MKKISLALILLLICIFALSACSRQNTDSGKLPTPLPESDTPSDVTVECDHAFGDWETSKEATCYEEGQLYRVCGKCSIEETQKIAKTNEHDFSVENTNTAFLASSATCWSPAKYYYSCVCGEKGTDIFEYGEKLSEHLYNDENTCTACGNYEDAGVVFTFDSQTNTYSVTDYKGTTTEIIIPSVYKGFPVSSIGEFAFSSCETITAVKLPSSIVSIDFAAFSTCTSLKSVTLENGIQKIGGYAFDSCSLLKNITLPNTIIGIEHNAFSECTSLTEITIPDSVVSIGEYAFNDCASLKSVTLGKGLEKIDKGAFADCSSLETIEFPSSLTEIGGAAFWGCTSLTEIVIPDTVEFIDAAAFAYCENLVKVTLPFLGDKKDNPTDGTFKYIFTYLHEPSVKEVILTGGNYCGLGEQIPDYAFDYYYSLEKITLPNTLVIIGNYAFSNTSLSDIHLPDSLRNIGKNAFSGCRFTSFTVPDGVTIMGEFMLGANQLESLTLPFIGERHSVYGELSHILGVHVGHTLKEITVTVGNKYGEHIFIPHYAFRYWSSIETINLPNGITKIGQDAFYGCTSLKSINIPDSIVSIGSYAFYECTALTSIDIPNGSIGGYAFYNCALLAEVTLGSVTSIGEKAFRGCTPLKSVTVPNTVTRIGIGAFGECNNLEEISIPFTGSQLGYNAGAIKQFGYIFADGNWGVDPDPQVYQHEVPRTLKTVYYTSAEDMLWHNAFESCWYVERIYISEGLETIGNDAFSDSCIKYISLPQSLTTIGTSAFEDCAYLEDIVLGNNITTINDNAFKYTTALKNVYFRGTEEEWNVLMENVREEYLYSATKHYNYTA